MNSDKHSPRKVNRSTVLKYYLCVCGICFVSQTKAVVSRLIKLDWSFQAVQLFKVCGPAGYTFNVKAHLDEDTVLIRDNTEPTET
jgi:hypothetical protein